MGFFMEVCCKIIKNLHYLDRSEKNFNCYLELPELPEQIEASFKST